MHQRSNITTSRDHEDLEAQLEDVPTTPTQSCVAQRGTPDAAKFNTGTDMWTINCHQNFVRALDQWVEIVLAPGQSLASPPSPLPPH